MADAPKKRSARGSAPRPVPRKKAAGKARVIKPPLPEEAPEFVTPTNPWPVNVEWPSVGYWMKVAAGVLVVFAVANMVVALRQILILILVSLILAIGIQPGVHWLVSKGMRRGSAVATIFVVGAMVVMGFLAMITPAIITQIGDLVTQAPDRIREAQEKNKFIADINERFDLTGKLTDLAENLPSTALSLIRSFTAFVFNLLTVMILTLYFATALPKMEIGIARLLRRENREEFSTILDESTGLVGGYMIGNLVVSVIAGAVSFVALLLIGVPYPAALAFWVALADLIPTVGALLGALAAVLVAAFAGVPVLVATIVFFVIYQQIENYVIAPRVMTRTVEMSAAAVIVAVLIGGTLAGFAGALLALPTAAIIKVILQRVYLHERLEVVRRADERHEAERSAPR
ncbi:MAG TPA: AI-2E family transporter [Actinomycetota bacterium]